VTSTDPHGEDEEKICETKLRTAVALWLEVEI
jgi:hypothetical protein